MATLLCGTLKAMLTAAASATNQVGRGGPSSSAALANLVRGIKWSESKEDHEEDEDDNEDDGDANGENSSWGEEDNDEDDDENGHHDGGGGGSMVEALREELEHVSEELERQRAKAVQRERVRWNRITLFNPICPPCLPLKHRVCA